MAQDVTQNVDSPGNDGEAVDISSVDHDASFFSRGLWVGTGGTVVVKMRGGSDLTFTNIQNGTLLPIRVETVYKTGTTASGMVLIW